MMTPTFTSLAEGKALQQRSVRGRVQALIVGSAAVNALLTAAAMTLHETGVGNSLPLMLAAVLVLDLAVAIAVARRLQTLVAMPLQDAEAAAHRDAAHLQSELRSHQTLVTVLRSADRRKDEFLATLAHELRNPLAPIRHAVKLLDARTANEQQQQWGRSVIERQVRRMALLLDDLLDISRITRGQLNLKVEVVELQSIIDAALEVARPLLETKQHRLTLVLPEEKLMLSVDPLRLSQCLSNLLTNAGKYTDEQGCVALTVGLSDDELKFTVADTGIGIDPHAIAGIFEMFSQVHSAVDRAEGGLGIGLALVKGLAELHGGRVEVASAGVGRGSEFSLYLPRSLVLTPTDMIADAAAEPQVLPPVDCKLLIADDNRDAVDSMAMIMQLLGYEVSVAYTGREALLNVRQNRPDVVLLDIGMPDMSGHEVARGIREFDPQGSIYLIAMTGWGQAEDKRRTRAAGFDEHLTKPVDPDQVAELLRAVMSRRVQPDR